jgi:hypothetical protein
MFRETKAYDFLAAMPVIVWYSFSIANMAPALLHDIGEAQSNGFDVHAAAAILSRAAAIGRRLPRAGSSGAIDPVVDSPQICKFHAACLEPRDAFYLFESIGKFPRLDDNFALTRLHRHLDGRPPTLRLFRRPAIAPQLSQGAW